MKATFLDRIYRNLSDPPEAVCCKVNDHTASYAEFAARVGSIQSKLKGSRSQVIGIATENSVDTYAAIIASWLTGKAFVPLNPEYPAERLRNIIEEAEISEILYVQQTGATQEMISHFPDIEFTHSPSLTDPMLFHTLPTVDKIAYILFTSGTTGKPKGVPISFGNLQAFTESFGHMGYDIRASDRFLQMFELTFDLSVMSYTIPLLNGASFYTLPSGMIKTLALYHVLESESITFSLMVPSAIQLLLPYIDDIDLPDMRYSQFCGEALKAGLVSKWAQCIPNATIDNVYGPTEATIYCTSKRITPGSEEDQSYKGILYIGKDLLHVKTALFVNGKPVTECNISGELCISGKQVTAGYLNNPLQNSQSFFEHEGLRFYKTGDLAMYHENGDLIYLGRLDDQVKIQGYRVELAEIEAAVKKALPDHENVAVAAEQNDGSWQLAVFIQHFNDNDEDLRHKLAQILPDYMIPHLILGLADFPLNANGKTDRKQLKEMLKAQKH